LTQVRELKDIPKPLPMSFPIDLSTSDVASQLAAYSLFSLSLRGRGRRIVLSFLLLPPPTGGNHAVVEYHICLDNDLGEVGSRSIASTFFNVSRGTLIKETRDRYDPQPVLLISPQKIPG
jgi:hypothetical protein